MAVGGPTEHTTVQPVRADPTSTEPYFAVFDEDSSLRFGLPDGCDLVIGRGADAGLRLRSPSVSRRHARVTRAGDDVRVVDVGSRNGILVNGQRIAGEHALRARDAVTLGNVTLIYYSSRGRRAERKLVDGKTFRARVAAETSRRLVVISVRFDAAPADAPMVERLLPEPDLAAWDRPDQLLLLLRDAGPKEAEAALTQLGEALSEADLGCAAGPGGTDLVAEALAGAGRQPGHLPRVIDSPSGSIIVADPAMERIYALVQRLAASDLPVLLCGETGTGKELAASAVHHWSARRQAPFVPVNCAALPDTLAESELFGYEKGAFSGAASPKAGLLESAAGGTVFLDEIGELSPAVQAKLLRALETQRVRRLGEVKERAIAMRIVAATHRDLEAEVRAGRFRQDLFFRLSAATVWLPPLRDRPHELVLLAERMLAAACERAGRRAMHLSPATLQLFQRYAWPGNIRELKNALEFAAASAPGHVVEPEHLPARLAPAAPVAPAAAATIDVTPFRPIDEEVSELERTRMVAALDAADGNQTKAAELINMPRRTFVAKAKRYGLAGRGPKRG